ncbi:hypothetical protein KR018_011011, partial [Drosophila ironensis]
YEKVRKAVLKTEQELMTGGHTYLSVKEAKANEIFMQYKREDLEQGVRDEEQNAAALHFFKAKPLIDRSRVFRFLREMPKGAVLHLHNSASVSSSWVVQNISYMQGMLRCTTTSGETLLTFRRTPKEHNCQSEYILVSDERASASNPKDYDQNFERLINLYTPTPEVEYPTSTRVWDKFQGMFNAFHDALAYLPAFRKYTWQMLEELYNDNIMYAEIRSTIRKLYDESGQDLSLERAVQEFLDVNTEFVRLHPDFLGFKIIFCVYRGFEMDRLRKAVNAFKKLREAFPNFVIGFDLVGQEDKGKPLYDLLPALRDLPANTRFFLHGGETNWFGAPVDVNLLDALLLNTTRIGHGFALAKHPIVMNAVKARNIAVEVSPISNQVLHLVWDLRNHPAAQYLALDIPIVICNDDPGFWNAQGLSYDFYYAIMSLAPNNAGVRLLKTLVWNSVRYSTLTEEEQRRAFKFLEVSWTRFIEKTVAGYFL